MFFKKIFILLSIGFVQIAYGQQLDKELSKASTYIDTTLFNGIVNSYLMSNLNILNKIRHKKEAVFFDKNSIKHIRVLDFDIHCFAELDCNYQSFQFYNCIKAKPLDGVMSFFTVEGNRWHYIESNFYGFRVFLDKFPRNFSSRNTQFPNLNELLKDIEGEIFFCLGYFCIYKNNQLLAYTGEQGFKELSSLFSKENPHNIVEYQIHCSN